MLQPCKGSFYVIINQESELEGIKYISEGSKECSLLKR